VLVLVNPDTNDGQAIAAELCQQGYGKVVLVRVHRPQGFSEEDGLLLPGDSDVGSLPMKRSNEVETVTIDGIREWGKLVKLSRRCTAIINVAFCGEVPCIAYFLRALIGCVSISIMQLPVFLSEWRYHLWEAMEIRFMAMP